ncbi:MAG: hypothetical protein ACYTG0_10515 [Planctomycetota bacterium]|jgi:hypothetical protein
MRLTFPKAFILAGVLVGTARDPSTCDAQLAGAGPGPLKVGVASANITPEESVWMAGFAARKESSMGVYKDLTATCVVFDNGVTRLALVALDLCKILEKQLGDLRAAAKEAGIPPQHVMVNCSHTHYGPQIGHAKNEDYDALFKARTDPLFEAAVADLKPAVLDYTVGSCTMAVSRRQLGADGKVTGMRPEPRKPIDPDVPILRVLSSEGEVRTVIFGYACHPTTVSPLHYQIGPDYPGFARDWIAAAYPGCTPVFLQGCGGDVKPRYTRPSSTGYGSFGYLLLDQHQIVAELGHELGRAVVAALVVPPEPVPAGRPDAPHEAGTTPIHLAGIVEQVDLPDKKDPEHKSHQISMGAWRIGDVYIFGSQCEICSSIGLRIKRELPGIRVWTNGYTHWGGGYVPDAASYPEEGYEVDRAAVSPAAEGIVVAGAIRYVRALQGRKTGHSPAAQPADP